jgi:uncharacterized protein (TIGR03435 family)
MRRRVLVGLLVLGGRVAGAQDSVPAWVTAAGGRAEFEVVSVREDSAWKFLSPPYSIDADDAGNGDYSGIFRAEMPLTSYISFAYKLNQQYPMLEGLPEWASKKAFVVQAQVAGKPTKDQVRLMVRAMLEERFGLKLHFETKEMPVLFMTLAAPGKMGPGLQLHSDGTPCNVVAERPKGVTPTFAMFPCEVYMGIDRPDHTTLMGARDTTMAAMTAFFSNVGKMRPIVDRTGITGRIDFSFVFVRERRGPAPVAEEEAVFGDTFADAVRKQLGLKLEAGRAGVAVPVVDRVELPTGN